MNCKAILLGSGTSSGVPVLGREYAPEFLANPKNWRTRPALLLQGPEGNVLVDAGPDIRHQLLRENILDIEATIITHTHADHIMGMDDLRAFCLRSGRPMPVYTFPEHQEDIRRVFAYAFREFPPGIEVPRFELYDAPEELSLAGLEIRLFPVMHGPVVRVIALRVGGFAYVTDVKTIPAESERWLEGLDTLVLDAVRLEPHRNHLNLEEALAVVEKYGPRRAILTHLGPDYDHDITNGTLPSGVELGYDGQSILIA